MHTLPALSIALLVGLLLASPCAADIYLQSPRGSNNKLNEQSDNRANANRLFDSENNGAAGYQVGDACYPEPCLDGNQYDPDREGAGEGIMRYYAGSELVTEWTAQHGCGNGEGKHTACEIVLQYMCGPDVRDGKTTDRIPVEDDDDDDDDDLERYGLHESIEYYRECEARERNRNLFTADQNLGGNRDRAINTRQNANGNRYGTECPEERDYYPYWHPTPWVDIAVLTTDVDRCALYRRESENVLGRGFCSDPQYNTEGACDSGDATWTETPGHGVAPPECLEAPFSRDNHHGNAGTGGSMASYNWTIPDLGSAEQTCVFRIRYNITTSDYDGWATDAGSNGDRSPIKQDPVSDFVGIDHELRVNVDTAQYGRVFEDRTHVFQVVPRPAGIGASARIYNLNVRGRRGNIVQVYPAVEYDFVPSVLHVEEGDYVHIQWTGSDANQRGNAGNGRDGTDRNNLVQLPGPVGNFPLDVAAATDPESPHHRLPPMFVTADGQPDLDLVERLAFLDQQGCDPEADDDDDPANCAVLNRSPAYMDFGLIPMRNLGTFHFASTRNNDFSNRSQKSILVVHPSSALSDGEIAAIAVAAVVGTAGIAVASYLALAHFAHHHPESWIGRSVCCVSCLFCFVWVRQRVGRENKVDPLAPADDDPKPTPAYIQWWSQNRQAVLFLFAYLVLNCALYAYGYLRYRNHVKWLALARGGGSMLNFNCAILVVPVLRNFVSWLRTTPVASVVPLDHAVAFHKIIFGTIVVATALHVGFHYRDFEHFKEHEGLTITEQAVGNLAGATGHAILVLMTVICVTAVEWVRRRYFDVFYMCHQLYIVVFALLLLHGPTFWVYALFPLSLLVVEKMIRRRRGAVDCALVKAEYLAGDVLVLHLRRSRFHFAPGQYAFISVPALGERQWHPFTITSAPDDLLLTFHIRCRGDWTQRLLDLVNPDKEPEVLFKAPPMAPRSPSEAPDQPPSIRVDGPYGAPAENVFDFETVVLVGAGIGITPFASIIKTLRQRRRLAKALGHGTGEEIQAVKLFWICRDQQEFEWFSWMLREIQSARDLRGVVTWATYVTGEVDLQAIAEGGTTALATHAGKPNWNRVFKAVAAEATSDVGVFLCGPAPLADALGSACRRHSAPNKRFILKQETF